MICGSVITAAKNCRRGMLNDWIRKQSSAFRVSLKYETIFRMHHSMSVKSAKQTGELVMLSEVCR